MRKRRIPWYDEEGIDGPFEKAIEAAIAEDAAMRECPMCLGTRSVDSGIDEHEVLCPRCHGEGQLE